MKGTHIICLLLFNLISSIVTSTAQNIQTPIYKTFELTNDVTIKMIWVKPGSYIMGSPLSEVGRIAQREKQHKVTITKGYWLAETEFTQEQWTKIIHYNPSKNNGKNLPVEHVSHNDIQQFLFKINRKDGKFRLPTEAEWEYACRANTNGTYAGDLEEMTWHIGNSGRKSHPVALKKPNAWGFYDMHGNILEKCSDWLQEDNTKMIIDPKGPKTGIYKVERGGQFTGRTRHTRSADRQRSLPTSRDFYVGFRLARSQD